MCGCIHHYFFTSAWITSWYLLSFVWVIFHGCLGVSLWVIIQPEEFRRQPSVQYIQYSTFLWCILHNNWHSFSYERVALHQESNLRKIDRVFMWNEALQINSNSLYIVCLYCMNWQDVWSDQPLSLWPESHVSLLTHWCFIYIFCPSSAIIWEEVKQRETVQHDRAEKREVLFFSVWI